MEGEIRMRVLYPIKIHSKQHPLVVVPHASQLTPASHIERILKFCGRMEKSEGFLEVLVPHCAVEVDLDNSKTILYEEEKMK